MPPRQSHATKFRDDGERNNGRIPGNFREIVGDPQMAGDLQFVFGQFRFDARTGELWRNRVEAKLTPRAASVLSTLVEHAQELVTKQELFDRVWGGITVSDDGLTSCIQELRAGLGDDAKHPRYIETLHRRGYRLMLPATPIPDRISATAASWHAAPEPSRLVGLVAELQELSRRFNQALAGHRQV